MEHSMPWWGEFDLAEGAAGCWTIGPARLWIEHHRREWHIGCRRDGRCDDAGKVELDLPPGRIAEGTSVHRYSVQSTVPRLSLLPLLADRPVISRPDMPLFIPPAQSIQLFVSTPLWWQVSAHGVVLEEQPVVRPSDTWAGPTTRDGGLSYAATTAARTTLDNFNYSCWRAVTPIRITNRGSNMAAVERLHLPVPFLSLYQAQDGTLWTETLILTRDDDDTLALEQLDTLAPAEAGTGTLLTGPRRRADRSLLAKTFGTLFGREGSDDGMD